MPGPALIDPVALDPVPQRVGVDPELLADLSTRAGDRKSGLVDELLTHQPDSSLTQLIGCFFGAGMSPYSW